MTEREFTVEDLANEIEVLVTTGKYIEAFSLLMDEANVTDTVQGEQNTVEFTWALGSKKFLSTPVTRQLQSDREWGVTKRPYRRSCI